MGTERPEQHHTDQYARHIFEAKVQPWAQPNRHADADYAIDYTVEMFEDTADGKQRAMGHDFQVQLKGTTRLDGNDESIAFRLDTGDLAHYLDNKHMPVFLVVVDVANGAGFWTFLQKNATELENQEWRQQETVTIRIPRTQSLEAGGGFRDGVIAAAGWMRERRPGSPQASLAAEKARLEALDQRLIVDLIVERGLTRIQLTPKEPVDLTVRVAGTHEAQMAFRDCVVFGTPFDPKANGAEIAVDGTPITLDGPITSFRYGNDTEAAVLITRRGEEDFTLEIPTTFTRGAGGMKGTARVGQGLLSLELTIELPPTKATMNTRWSFCRSEWHGRSVSGFLNDYDRLVRVFGNSRPTDAVFIHVRFGRNLVCTGELSDSQASDVINSMGYVETVRRLRRIAKATQIDFAIPENIEPGDFVNLNRAWELLEGHTVPIKMAETVVCLECPKERTSELWNNHLARGDLALPREQMQIPVLGRDIDLGPVLVKVEDVELSVEDVSVPEDQPNATARIRISEPRAASIRQLKSPEELKQWFGK